MEWINLAFLACLFNIHYVDLQDGCSVIQLCFSFTNINALRTFLPYKKKQIPSNLQNLCTTHNALCTA